MPPRCRAGGGGGTVAALPATSATPGNHPRTPPSVGRNRDAARPRRARTSNRVCAHQIGCALNRHCLPRRPAETRGVQQVVGRVGASAAALLPRSRRLGDRRSTASGSPRHPRRGESGGGSWRRDVRPRSARPTCRPARSARMARRVARGTGHTRSGVRTSNRVCAQQTSPSSATGRSAGRPTGRRPGGATAALLPPRGHAGSAVGDRQPRTRRGGAGPVAARGADGPRPRFGKTSTRRVARPTVDPCPPRRPTGVSGRARRFLPRPTTPRAPRPRRSSHQLNVGRMAGAWPPGAARRPARPTPDQGQRPSADEGVPQQVDVERDDHCGDGARRQVGEPAG